MKTDGLLQPRKRVFTKEKRPYGPLSIVLGLISTVVLADVYAAYTGSVFPDGFVMLGMGLVGAIGLPFLVARRARRQWPRLFAGINVALGLALFTVLGARTDRALEQHGDEPFRAVAGLLADDGGARARIEGAGASFVSVLRRMTLDPFGSHSEGADPTPSSGAPDVPTDPALQAAVEEAVDTISGADGHTAGDAAADIAAMVEVPIATDGRTVTVGALVNGTVPADFTFDTGADSTAITPALARRLGFRPADLRERRRFLTAAGPVDEPVVRLESVSIDSAEVRGLDVMVCSRCPRNLLGRDFQRHFRVELDSQTGHLRLYPR